MSDLSKSKDKEKKPSKSSRLKCLAAGMAGGAAAGFCLNPLLFPAGAIAGGFVGNKVFRENKARELRQIELGAQWQLLGDSCSVCGASDPKNEPRNCYGCGRRFCGACRDESHSFSFEEPKMSISLKVCKACKETLTTIQMTDMTDMPTEVVQQGPLYDFSAFRMDAPPVEPVPTGLQPSDVRVTHPDSSSVPAYARNLSAYPAAYETLTTSSNGSMGSMSSMSFGASNTNIYADLYSSASAPPAEDIGPIPVYNVPNLDAGADRFERVITAAALFPDSPSTSLYPSCPPAEECSTASLDLNTATQPELQMICEQVAALHTDSNVDSPAQSGPTSAAEVDELVRKDWEASWDLPPAVLAKRAMSKLSSSDGSDAPTTPEEDSVSLDAEGDDSQLYAMAVPSQTPPSVSQSSAAPALPSSAASLFPDAPSHDI